MKKAIECELFYTIAIKYDLKYFHRAASKDLN